MSRDRPGERQRREVERSVETSGSARDAGNRSSGADFVPFGWPTLPGRARTGGTAAEERYDRRAGEGDGDDYGRERARSRGATGDDTRVDEGLITLLIVAGVALVLFPEPLTSAIGLVLVASGVVAWLVDLAT